MEKINKKEALINKFITNKLGALVFQKNPDLQGLFSSRLHLRKGEIEKVGPELFLLMKIETGKQEFIKKIFINLRIFAQI